MMMLWQRDNEKHESHLISDKLLLSFLRISLLTWQTTLETINETTRNCIQLVDIFGDVGEWVFYWRRSRRMTDYFFRFCQPSGEIIISKGINFYLQVFPAGFSRDVDSCWLSRWLKVMLLIIVRNVMEIQSCKLRLMNWIHHRLGFVSRIALNT